ncbi:MAG: hypothetical protein K6E30_02810 [Lachnospiraceae bacterium]|nr:hypothetical protein [Lachnospiraceae bacterium]
MEKIIKKLFGGLDLTWPKLITAAVAAGVFTAAMAIIPAFQYTSFSTITTSFEVWILIGILIIMNSRSNLDSALKCFVFFLISQPLIYLLQVPFSWMGWRLFGYYKYWLIWTILCLPMGYIGYWMKKDKWWGYLILFPMILLTAYSYSRYLASFIFYMPKYILICIFCVCAMVFYPVFIFRDEKTRRYGAVIGLSAAVVLTVLGFMNPPVYSTELMGSNEEHPFDDTYKASLADEKYGDVEIIYMKNVEDYMLHAELRKAGKTVLTIEAPDGGKREFDLVIEYDTYEVTPRE